MSVFESQRAQRVAVGDANQQLFAWNGSQNAMSKFESDLKVKLTQSWRFGTAIQDAANVFLDMLDADIRLQGNPRVPSKIIPNAPFDPTLTSSVLTRTNAGAIQELITALSANQSAHLIGGSKSFVSLIEAAEALKAGRATSHADLAGFSNWAEVEAYVGENTPESMDLGVIVRLVKEHGTARLLTALNSCTSNEEDAQTVISTVHKVKGREWDQVRISDDFIRKTKKKEGESPYTDEALMLYYVAVTRAKTLLDPGSLEPMLSRVVTAGASVQVAEPEPLVLPIEDRLSVSLSADVKEKLRARFANRDEAEAFLEQLLQGALQ